MLGKLTTCSSSIYSMSKIFLNRLSGCKRRRRLKGLCSNSDLMVSSFAQMDISNQFEQVFKLIDSNEDGRISSFELSQVLHCLGYKKSKAAEEAEVMVKELDSNEDGFIDLEEFMVVMNDKKEDEIGGGNEEGEDHLMDAFLIFDSDNNGLISAKELQRVLTNLGCNKCSLKDCKRMIKGVDHNGDGFVDFQEFRSMMSSRCTN